MRRATIAIAIAVVLALPSAASAQYAPFPEEGEPGVTIAGVGLARTGHEALADRRAMRDARRRAAAIARAAGVSLGEATGVELQDAFSQFGPRGGPFTASIATVTYAIAGGGQGEGLKVSAYGDASVRVRPRHPRSNRSIRRTLLSARAAVIPRAAADGVRTARRAAVAAGLELGPIVSISQPPDGYFYDPALGGFGPGVYCKTFRRRGEARRRCYRNPSYRFALEVTYEAR